MTTHSYTLIGDDSTSQNVQ